MPSASFFWRSDRLLSFFGTPVAVLGFVLASTLGYLAGLSQGSDFPGVDRRVRNRSDVRTPGRGGHLPGRRILLFPLAPYLVGVERAPTWTQALSLGEWLLVLLTVAEVARSRREQAIESARAHGEEERRRASKERRQIAQNFTTCRPTTSRS